MNPADPEAMLCLHHYRTGRYERARKQIEADIDAAPGGPDAAALRLELAGINAEVAEVVAMFFERRKAA